MVEDQVELVKQKTDIVTLVGERVKLSRAGRNFRALCPFHSERTPSFMVSPELGIFKCFGCGKAGDVYTFLQEFDGMDFPEALRYLAKRAGIQLAPLTKDRDFQRKERLRALNYLASEFYHYLLVSHGLGKVALAYLTGRGIRKAAIDVFGIGFAPERWDALIRYLVGRKHYTLEELEAVGLVVRSGGRTYDRFRKRVIFPLRDTRGNVIGFSGRVLPGDEGEGGKYINSPDTELYHKSEHLYGLYENRSEIKKKDTVVVVEGELDAISSWQAGLKYVVAIKGTAMTEGQVELLRRYTRDVVLALDADSAGNAATKRGIAIADSASLNINVVLLSGGKDPDAIAQSDPNKWRELVAKATSVYDFYLSSARSRFDATSGLGKKQISEELVPVLSHISNAVERAHYIKKLAQLLDVSDDVVIDEIHRFERNVALGGGKHAQASVGKKEELPEQDRRRVLEEYLLSLLLSGGKLAIGALGDFAASELEIRVVKRIVERLLKVPRASFKAGGFIASLPAELRETAQQSFLADLGDVGSDAELLRGEVERVVAMLRQLRLRDQLGNLSARIKVLEGKPGRSKPEDHELEELRQEFVHITQKLSH